MEHCFGCNCFRTEVVMFGKNGDFRNLLRAKLKMLDQFQFREQSEHLQSLHQIGISSKLLSSGDE